jgi:NADH dehydrogenase
MSTVLVTGASGFVGSHVVPELLGAGHRVVALVRSPSAGEKVRRRLPATLAAGLELRTGDVLSPGTLPAALAGVDAVAHLVAIPRDWNDGKDLLRVNLGGTQHVVAAMREAGVRRLVHLGALGVEDREDLHYAKSKARAEQVVRESGLDWTILRPSLLFGPRDGFFNIVAGLVRVPFPLVPVPGDGKSRFQPLHVADLALCLRLAVERPETIGRSFDLGGPRTWTYREITAEVARALGKRRVIVPLPLPLIRLAAGTAEALHLRFFPVATDQLRQLALDNVGPLDGVHRAFGFVPRRMEGELLHLRHPTKQQEPAPAA